MEIRTTRLLLREFRLDDYEALRAIQVDPRMLVYEPPALPEEEARKKLERWVSEQYLMPRKHFGFAVTIPPNDRVRGWLTLTLNFEETREWETGWMIEHACWGNGYATEAAKALLKFGFEVQRAHRVSAFCHADNQGSVRVMEKLGMTQEGRLRQVRQIHGKWADEFIYSILESELQAP
jgi:RimJ/RimL family protein N-acetyltransferase